MKINEETAIQLERWNVLSKSEAEIVRIIEELLKKARGQNCSICRILTQVCAKHSFSTEADECHIDRKEFGPQIDEYDLISLKELTKDV